MEWGDVNGWVGLGGAKLGSKRALPTGKMDKIAENLRKFKLQASCFFKRYQTKIS